MKSISWATREFSEVDLGDKRLNKRLVKLCDSLSELPESSINQACEDWAETKAAYRFFKNERVDSESIVSAHRSKTAQRAQQHEVILAIQDTSYVMYTHHPETTGLGQLKRAPGRNVKDIYSKGLSMHTCLAVTTEGLPLGLLDQRVVVRPDNQNGISKYRHEKPIEEKESYRWLRSMKKAVASTPGTKVVTVCDREADIYEFIELSHKLNSNVLIRANVNRSINKKSTAPAGKIERLWEYMDSQPACGVMDIEVQEIQVSRYVKARAARTAKVEIKFGSFILNPTYNKSVESLSIPMHAVYVIEKNPPEGIAPLEWMLITNLPVTNLEEASEKIRWYKLRWRIEMFFKVLKSGFKVEECRLSDGKRLIKYLTIMGILACRLFSLTLVARSEPETPCNLVLSPDELKVLSLKIKKKTSKNVLTIAQAVIAIAMLGGFLARKNDGNPGSIVLWRGWKRLQDLVEGFNLAQDARTCG